MSDYDEVAALRSALAEAKRLWDALCDAKDDMKAERIAWDAMDAFFYPEDKRGSA